MSILTLFNRYSNLAVVWWNFLASFLFSFEDISPTSSSNKSPFAGVDAFFVYIFYILINAFCTYSSIDNFTVLLSMNSISMPTKVCFFPLLTVILPNFASISLIVQLTTVLSLCEIAVPLVMVGYFYNGHFHKYCWFSNKSLGLINCLILSNYRTTRTSRSTGTNISTGTDFAQTDVAYIALKWHTTMALWLAERIPISSHHGISNLIV